MVNVIEELALRITALIPAYPQILFEGFDTFDLRGVPGFRSRDLRPKPADIEQALALAKARGRHAQGYTSFAKTQGF